MLPLQIQLDLSRRYCEAHRRYHTIEHIADMLWRGRELELSDVQILAIWYHDAIYDVPGEKNEARSAELALEQLAGSGLKADAAERVAQIVRDTEAHIATSEEAEHVIDLDLASLAAPWQVFERNSKKIREEYACIEDERFRVGRLAMLDRFLARERIYQSAWGAQFEDAARENLRRLRTASST